MFPIVPRSAARGNASRSARGASAARGDEPGCLLPVPAVGGASVDHRSALDRLRRARRELGALRAAARAERVDEVAGARGRVGAAARAAASRTDDQPRAERATVTRTRRGSGRAGAHVARPAADAPGDSAPLHPRRRPRTSRRPTPARPVRPRHTAVRRGSPRACRRPPTRRCCHRRRPSSWWSCRTPARRRPWRRPTSLPRARCRSAPRPCRRTGCPSLPAWRSPIPTPRGRAREGVRPASAPSGTAAEPRTGLPARECVRARCAEHAAELHCFLRGSARSGRGAAPVCSSPWAVRERYGPGRKG